MIILEFCSLLDGTIQFDKFSFTIIIYILFLIEIFPTSFEFSISYGNGQRDTVILGDGRQEFYLSPVTFVAILEKVFAFFFSPLFPRLSFALLSLLSGESLS